MRILLICLLLSTTLAHAQSFQRLHRRSIVADTHNDFPSISIEQQVAFDADLSGRTHSDLARLKKGGIDIQVFSIFCGPEQQAPYRFANREMDSVIAWTKRNTASMVLVENPAALEDAIRARKIATLMGVEGGHMIEDRLEKLDTLYQRGARYMTLTWNNSTNWATSAADETTKKDSLPFRGLTSFGKQVVGRMNELGMLVDVSHAGEQTFWDAIAVTTKPIIASHSGAWQLCRHRRNLKDGQIRAIAQNGGVIFVNFYSGFIDSTYDGKFAAFITAHRAELDSMKATTPEQGAAERILIATHAAEFKSIRAPLSLLIDHIDHIVSVAGIDHVGLGSDFDGIEAPPRELNGVEDFSLVTQALRKRGYSRKAIKKILGGNFRRVFAAAQATK